jgi:two-component system response regulator DesR
MRADSIVINSESSRIGNEVKEYLLKANSMDKIYVVNNNNDFTSVVKKHKPRLALVESSCWFEATPYIIGQYLESHPMMSVIVFSYERHTAAKAAGYINLGAESFIDLRLEEDEIMRAFQIIAKGKSYVPPSLSADIDKYCLAIPEYSTFTKGEIPILRLAGLCNDIEAIGIKLKIARGTVRNHISNIHKKFNIHSTAELVGLALQFGYVQPEELVRKEINLQAVQKEVKGCSVR